MYQDHDRSMLSLIRTIFLQPLWTFCKISFEHAAIKMLGGTRKILFTVHKEMYYGKTLD